MPREDFSTQLWNGLADAIADIREKVVEEPMWGRVVSERDSTPLWQQEQQPDFGSIERTTERTPERDLDIDR
jgi:hypothetical protein